MRANSSVDAPRQGKRLRVCQGKSYYEVNCIKVANVKTALSNVETHGMLNYRNTHVEMSQCRL